MPKSDYPKLELDNGKIRVSVYLPDAVRGYYRGTRFDWSGIIERVDTTRHRFYQPLHAVHDPHTHDCVSGPAEEFAMFHPMGYREAAPGESFVKVGVGLLRKRDDSEYQFNGDYELVRPGGWQIEHGPHAITFRQDLEDDRGWAYRYHKVIRLAHDAPELTIRHDLENLGIKHIDIDHYNHNFTLIDGAHYGSDYRVEFPFSTTIPIRINRRAWFRGNAIEVPEPLGDASLWIPLYEGAARTEYNGAVVTHRPSGASVDFRGDAPITRMVFWAVERAACPEPFIRLRLAPGQAKAWSTRYRYRDGD